MTLVYGTSMKNSSAMQKDENGWIRRECAQEQESIVRISNRLKRSQWETFGFWCDPGERVQTQEERHTGEDIQRIRGTELQACFNSKKDGGNKNPDTRQHVCLCWEGVGFNTTRGVFFGFVGVCWGGVFGGGWVGGKTKKNQPPFGNKLRPPAHRRRPQDIKEVKPRIRRGRVHRSNRYEGSNKPKDASRKRPEANTRGRVIKKGSRIS